MGLSKSKTLKPTPQPFPLLRLPSVPLGEALKCFNPIELFTLSQCSKKVIGRIKLARTQKFHLSVNFFVGIVKINDKHIFEVKSSDDHDFEMKGNRNFVIKDVKMTVPEEIDLKDENALLFVCDDTFTGTRTICLHLCEIFGCKVDHLYSGDNAEKLRLILGEILVKQDEIANFNLVPKNFKDEHLTWILDTIKVKNKFILLFESSEHFRYNFKTFPEDLMIVYAFWFTLDNLLSLNNSCVKLVLTKSKLTNEDLNVFMKLWKAGKYPKLEFLYVQSKYFNDKTPIGGLTVMRNTLNPIRKEKRIKGFDYYIDNGVDIQRDDGIMATFELNWCCLNLLVWT